jgi:hypothetical protein
VRVDIDKARQDRKAAPVDLDGITVFGRISGSIAAIVSPSITRSTSRR